MRLEYQKLLGENPELEGHLSELPGAVFSGRKLPAKGTSGVFFCYGLPALDTEKGEFTEEAGMTGWYLYNLGTDDILHEPAEIIESIRSKPNTARKCVTEQRTLIEIRDKVRQHIKNTYEKRLDVPMDAPKPSLKCWMELNEG